MKWAVRDVDELRRRLNLPPNSRLNSRSKGESKTNESMISEAINKFPVFVPLPFLARIQPGNLDDPLLRQVLPLAEEEAESPVTYSFDPLAEGSSKLSAGLLQKYEGRVLLVTTGACAVNCRYCFRRHFPYQESPKSISQWKDAIQQIADDESIEEVILSGGDPLTLVDETLSQLVGQLDSTGHLKRLRIHTRLPIMIPQRINQELLETLAGSRMQSIVVIHSNHEREFDQHVEQALKKLLSAGVTLLNQSVLLRGINDDAETLIGLSKRLLECQVMPYYLHKNDPVIGTSHFEVSVERGRELIQAMRSKLPGYAVPRLVQEIAGEPNKTILA